MRNKFDEQLERLHVELIQMGALCEDAISAAAQALLKGDEDLARAAEEAEREIDQKEREVENLCLKLLLQQQPVATGPAGDLRGAEDDLRSGAHRRPGGGHRGADPLCAVCRKATGRLHIEEMAQAVIRHGDRQRGLLCQAGSGRWPGTSARADDQVDALFDQVKQELIGLIAADAELRRAVPGSSDGGQVSGADRRPRHQRGGVGGVLHYGESPLQQLREPDTVRRRQKRGTGRC